MIYSILYSFFMKMDSIINIGIIYITALKFIKQPINNNNNPILLINNKLFLYFLANSPRNIRNIAISQEPS